MNNYSEHIDELCAKALLGEASEHELQELRDWRALSDENEAYYLEMEKSFSGSNSLIPQIRFDVDKAWQQVRSRITNDQSTTPVISLQSKSLSNVWKIAASVVLLVGITVFVFLKNQETTESFALQSYEEPVRDTLSDGTITVLNAHSEIAYAFDEREKKRTVTLKGEAFFEVKHNDSIDFTVHADELMIRDIGTAFNVQALPGSDTIKVYVREGIVELYTASLQGVRIEDMETGYYVKSTREFGKFKLSEDVNPDTYATGDFRFRNTKLDKVVNKLSQYFDVSISLESPEMKNCAWSIHFLDSDLETILDVFAETFAFNVERNGKTILLKGGTCQDIEE